MLLEVCRVPNVYPKFKMCTHETDNQYNEDSFFRGGYHLRLLRDHCIIQYSLRYY